MKIKQLCLTAMVVLFALPCFAKDFEERENFNDIKRAAENGNAEAQFYLGIMYAEGITVSKNLTETEKWWRKAAEHGDATSQANLGAMYYYGEGVVKKDLKEAAKWVRKAAEQGVGVESYKLGIMYENGEGVDKDYAQAVKWYSKEAEKGLYAPAIYNLGMMYFKGKGVKKDYVQAYKWFYLIKKNDPQAAENIHILEKEMTPDQIAEGKRLATEWQAQHQNQPTKGEEK